MVFLNLLTLKLFTLNNYSRIRNVYRLSVFVFALAGSLSATERIYLFDRKNDDKFINKIISVIHDSNACLITNQSTLGKYLFKRVTGDLSYLHKLLKKKNINLIKIFSAEHGLSSQEEEDGNDQISIINPDIKVNSINRRTIKEMKVLYGGCDVVIFDLPDVGIRPYTYRTILTRTIEALAQLEKVRFVLIDYPNPASFMSQLPPVANEKYFSYLGEQVIPFFPGYTYAEITRYYISKRALSLNTSYLILPSYRPGYFKEYETILPPSPALPHKRALNCYWIGIFFEATTIDYGRYSKDPFCVIGHPDFDLSKEISGIENIDLSPFVYQPSSGAYKNKLIPGYRIVIKDVKKLNALKTAYQLIKYFNMNYPRSNFLIKYQKTFKLDLITGSDSMSSALINNAPFKLWIRTEKKIINKFNKEMKTFRLY